jgi:hypothetical protein
MQGRRSAVVIALSHEQREELERMVRSRSVAAGLQRRARAVLAIADGKTFRQARQDLDLSDKHLRKWCRRYLAEGIDGLKDRPGRGRKPVFSPRGRGAGCQTGL